MSYAWNNNNRDDISNRDWVILALFIRIAASIIALLWCEHREVSNKRGDLGVEALCC